MRIAKILHDEVGQIMSAAGLQIELLRMDFEGKAPEIRDRTAEIQKLLDRAMVQLRKLINELSPGIERKVE